MDNFNPLLLEICVFELARKLYRLKSSFFNPQGST